MSTMQRCASCRRLFRGRAQVRGQRYCAARAQEAWRIRHPGYWRAYRATHAHYTNANRAQQAHRDAARHLAKMDVSTGFSPGVSGIYRLSAAGGGDLAKSDAWTVELTVLSRI